MKKPTLTIILAALLTTTLAAQNGYRIAQQDVLTITVFGEPDLSGKYNVELDGTFTFPLLGRMTVGGLTLREFELQLKKALADGFLKNPQVTVAVDPHRGQRILVLGEVRAPGEYQLTGDMTLLVALARAGGPTPLASKDVVIVRAPQRPAEGGVSPEHTGGDSEILRINMSALEAGDLSMNVELQDGDTINLPKAQSVFVAGQVKTPGAYATDRGTTVLQVLSLAGGITDRGAEGRVRILRTVRGKKTEIHAKLTDPVEPGDTVVVPERFF